DPKTFETLAGRFDLIICTVGSVIDWNAYLNLLKIDGSMVLVGVPEHPVPVHAFSVIGGRRSLSGSGIGSIKETQEMLDFCGKHDIVAEIEKIDIKDINTAYERILKSDVRYRFVIDMATL
ncbi:MAG: zinc-binding dehydrogenase, partial [Janthinobacterium lividum]